MNNIAISAEELSVLVEQFARDRLIQLANAAAIDKLVAACRQRLYDAHLDRFGHLAAIESDLLEVINRHPEWFADGKPRRTLSARYGLRRGRGVSTVGAAAADGAREPGAESADRTLQAYLDIDRALLERLLAADPEAGPRHGLG
ncbi:MAG: hypothetical protein PHQ27_08185 [Victivallales bacterium]|nr:hypothetical protein [Victivallales bacterium]